MSKLTVVGLGPGDRENMTGAAFAAMEQADVLAGYTVYIDLVKDAFPGKELYSTPMMGEIERCREAVRLAQEGKNVAMLCSGDSGVYGMAGLILQLSEGTGVDVEIIPGVTAALSGAAVLGAPLMHDFCLISLSDLLTDYDLIMKRVECAAMGDFCICLYNPMSHKRREHLRNACDIMMKYKSPDTVCGWVKNIGRDGQEKQLLTLKELRDTEVDMFTTVFIGNSSTRVIDGKMVTPRGYEKKL